MKTNKLIPLFVITAIVVAAAIFTTHRQKPTAVMQKTALFPDFKAVINDVHEISVKQGKQTLTVVDEGGKWKIRQADGYPALFSKVKQTALAVSEMQVISKKTEDPSFYAQLGVEDPAADNAKSSLLTITDSSGKTLVSLIVGKGRLSPAASNSHGLYVRLPDQKQALLVESDLRVSVKVADWIDRNLMDIVPARISRINIVHGGGQDVTFERVPGKKDLELDSVPKGKQARTDYTLKRMESILEDIRIDDVKSAAQIKFPDSAVTATVTTTDGLTAVITSADVDEKHYASFAFQYKAPEKTQQQPAADKDKDKKKVKGKVIDVAKEATELTEKTSGWVYQIPAYKYDTFTRKLSDLVEDIPKKEADKKKSKG